MAHDLSHFVSDRAQNARWNASPYMTGFPYCEPQTLLYNATLRWLAQPGCKGCPREQTTANHSTRYEYLILNQAGNLYRGPNPFPPDQSPCDLDKQLRFMMMFIWWLGQGTGNGWWSVLNELSGEFMSTIFNAADAEWNLAPNFHDGVYFPITAVSGRKITIDTSPATGRDPRNAFFLASPIDAGDVVFFFGNTQADFRSHGMIVAIDGIDEGMRPSRPNSVDIWLDKDISETILARRDTGIDWHAQAWVSREYNFPQQWIIPEPPDLFWGTPREVVYTPASSE